MRIEISERVRRGFPVNSTQPGTFFTEIVELPEGFYGAYPDSTVGSSSRGNSFALWRVPFPN
jgi:hypothetical protein